MAYLANLRKGVYHNGTVVDGKYVKGDFSGKKPIIYIMQVIEYQNRGLPHAHIVYRIGTAPEPSRHQESSVERDQRRKVTVQYIDGYDEVNEKGQHIRHLGHVSACRPGKVDKPPNLREADDEAQCIYDEIIGIISLKKNLSKYIKFTSYVIYLCLRRVCFA